MKVLTKPNQCRVTEVGSGNTYLTTFPEGNKVKYMGQWFKFVDKFFADDACVLIFAAKDGRQIIYKSLPKYIEI